MEEKKFYAVFENGEELQVIASLSEAALEWEISPDSRNVYQVTPDHASGTANATWTRVREVPSEELLGYLKSTR